MPTAQSPRISVIIPYFNRLGWCLEALRSALRQTHPSFEILLVDDGSTEDISGQAELKDPRVTYLRQENQGAAAARNLGLEQARGEFIAFLDSDDLWLPDKLTKQVAQMEVAPDVWMSHTSYVRIDPEGRRLGNIDSGQFAGQVFPRILVGCPIATPTVMIRRAVIEAGLRFPTGLTVSEDILFWSGIAQHSSILGLTEALSLVRLDGGNASLSPKAQIQGLKNVLEHGILNNPALDLHQRKRLTSTLYTRIAALAQEGGNLPGFMAATVLAWLTPLAPAGRQDALAASLARALVSDHSLAERLLAEQMAMPADTPSEDGLASLEQVFRAPYVAYQEEATRRALASKEPLPLHIQGLPEPPLLSVLVPTYNQAGFLPATLDSLLAQTYPHWEALVVNDGSTDTTPEVLAAYAERDPRFRVSHKSNGGVATALNEGIRQAKGDWLFWLSSDDLFQADKLAWHLDAILDQPDIRFFHANFLLLDDQQQAVYTPETHPRGVVPRRELQTSEFLLRNYINGISIALHRTVFDRVGLFDERLRNGQDFDMWMRISTHYPSAFIDKPTCLLRIHPAQGTAQFPAAGILDSGLACLNFLNSNPFEALFPLLDLERSEDLSLALSTTILHAANPFAFVTFSGFAPALLSRLHEWMTQKCPAPLRAECFHHYNATVQAIRATSAPDWIKQPFVTLASSKHRHVYAPFQPRKELERQTEAFRKAGSMQGAFDLARYLRKYGDSHLLS